MHPLRRCTPITPSPMSEISRVECDDSAESRTRRVKSAPRLGLWLRQQRVRAQEPLMLLLRSLPVRPDRLLGLAPVAIMHLQQQKRNSCSSGWTAGVENLNGCRSGCIWSRRCSCFSSPSATVASTPADDGVAAPASPPSSAVAVAGEPPPASPAARTCESAGATPKAPAPWSTFSSGFIGFLSWACTTGKLAARVALTTPHPARSPLPSRRHPS